MDFVRNLLLFPAVKFFFENPLRIDKVISMSWVYYFLGTQCRIFNSNLRYNNIIIVLVWHSN